jgi:Family of unknown function (DUF6158)
MAAGVPVTELTDAELEAQGTAAHATRNWVFLHGTAEQFRHHTERMLALEQEYLRRFPKRTWQGSGDSASEIDEATRLRLALRGLGTQIEALLAGSPEPPPPTQAASPEQVRRLLAQVATAGGRMHKLEVHQVAREVGLDPASLAALYRGSDPLLRTERDERVLTDAGRLRLDADR